MNVRILQRFHDKADYRKVYLVGETATFDDARAESLIALGLVEAEEAESEAIEESEEPKKAAKPKTRKKKNQPKDNE